MGPALWVKRGQSGFVAFRHGGYGDDVQVNRPFEENGGCRKGEPDLRFSTSTLATGSEVVPWLAASGELAYSPQSPPERDYFFQYSWVVPGILGSGANRRRHYWFGDPGKDTPDVKLLFRFWSKARRGECDALFVSNGMVGPLGDVTAPLAAYRHEDVHSSGSRRERLILIQHGSFHIGDIQSQPLADRGEAVLYRGIQNTETYLLRRLTTEDIRVRLNSVHAKKAQQVLERGFLCWTATTWLTSAISEEPTIPLISTSATRASTSQAQVRCHPPADKPPWRHLALSASY